jgi:uncharacterized protein
MTTIIDRRKNTTTSQNLSNRQRFIKRAKDQIKRAVQDSIQSKKIDSMTGKDDNIKIPVRDLNEPEFKHSQNEGARDFVYNGNKDYIPGDKIRKPDYDYSKGPKATNDGYGEDEFIFELSRDEFLDIFFEDLELPDMVKDSLKDMKKVTYQRSGYTNTGSPTNIDVRRTARQALSRRIALKRPKKDDIEKLEKEIDSKKLLMSVQSDTNTKEYKQQEEELKDLEFKLSKLKRKMITVPWVDPVDVRYRNFEPRPKPITQAVVFCIMDISGSMGQIQKDIAKRFFLLLYFFLQRKYETINIVFISHTQDAKEVTEEEFFNSRENGGTVVSSALSLMSKIIKERYPVNDWNIYCAQASDGDNFMNDSEKCVEILQNEILNKLQYMAYLDIRPEENLMDEFRAFGGGYIPTGGNYTRESDLWIAYKKIQPEFKNFQMTVGTSRKDIFNVFRKLFSKKEEA